MTYCPGVSYDLLSWEGGGGGVAIMTSVLGGSYNDLCPGGSYNELLSWG